MRKRMWLYILVTLAIIIAAFLVVASRQPESFRVQRSAVIAAPPEAIFAQVNNLHDWPAWSPWANLDPNVQYTYTGPDSGEGAAVAWSGNRKAGQGKMTVLESKPGELIRIRIDFVKPFASTSMAEFTFVPQGHGTFVTWSMSGDNNFISKAMQTVCSMDRMIGPDFDRGLASLKTLVETRHS